MPREAARHKGISIRLACPVFQVSQTCYRYNSKRNVENERDSALADPSDGPDMRVWLVLPVLAQHPDYGRNQKRVYRIYSELELNLRIKLRK